MSALRLTGPGNYEIAVVGTSRSQRALESIAGRKTEESKYARTNVVLHCESENPHDENAVQVVNSHGFLGHLGRDDAHAYRRALAAAGYEGYPVVCKAMVVGGWYKGPGDEGSFGLRIDAHDWDNLKLRVDEKEDLQAYVPRKQAAGGCAGVVLAAAVVLLLLAG